MTTTARLDEAATFLGHKDAVMALGTCETPCTKLLFSASRDRRVIGWSLDGGVMFGRIVKEFAKHGHGINDVAVAKSGSFVVSAGCDALGRIIDVQSGDRMLMRGHESELTCATINAQENKIVTGSVDRTLRLWNMDGELQHTFGAEVECAHEDWVTCAEFRPLDENEVVSGSVDGTVKVWDVDARVVKYTFFDGCLVQSCAEGSEYRTRPVADGSFAVRALALSADGSCCAYGGSNCKTYILNLAESEAIATFETDTPVSALAFGLTDVILACGTLDKIYIWDVVGNCLLAVADLSAHGARVRCRSLVWTTSNLIAGLGNGKILVFEFVR